jgi:hypothetical protein
MSLLDFFGGTRYAYDVGNLVFLVGSSRVYEVHWRGYLLLGPRGQRRRYPVYWLGEETGDECYYEDELHSLNALPF